MTQSKHTPGPWTYQGIGPSFDVTAQATSGARFMGRFIARCPERVAGFEPTEEDERQANAHLIAAAPELLGALKEMANKLAAMMQDYELPEECNGIISGELDAANIAIAKAEGSTR